MFVQIMHFRTYRYERIRDIAEEWQIKTEGKRTARRSIVTRSVDDLAEVTVIVFFDSPESAAENSALPETQAFAAALNELIDGEITFHDLLVDSDEYYG